MAAAWEVSERKRKAFAAARERGRFADQARRAIQEQLSAQAESEIPPDWFEGYVSRYPLPTGIAVRDAWDLRTRAADRSADLELWWMLCFLGGGHYLTVPSGLLQGRPFELQSWQREFLEQAFRVGCLESTLSTARKSGKSTLLAALICYHLDRHGLRAGWRGLAVSLGGPQAEQLWSDTNELMLASGLYSILDEDTGLQSIKGIRMPPGRFRVQSQSVEFRLMTSNPKTSGVGASADLILLDEIGAYPDNARSLIRNMETSTSARGGRTIAISVEGIGNTFMSERERRAKADPARYHYRQYSAPKGCALDDEDAWRAANPSLGTVKSIEYMRAEAFKALMNPADQASFRNLELNQRVSETNDTLCTPDDWTRLETATLPDRRGPLLVGIDLGGARAFSAAVAVWPETGRVEGLQAIGGIPSLIDRGRSDGVDNRYQRMCDEGTLVVIPDMELVEHDAFIELVESRFGTPDLAVADEYRRAEFGAALRARGAHWNVQLRRMGAGKSGGEDLRALQRAIVRQEISVWGPSVAWTSAIAETAVRYHPTTRLPSIKPRRQTARIDLIAAATLALGAMSRWQDEQAAIAADTGPATAIMPW